MKTRDLINVLVADRAPISLRPGVAIAIAVGLGAGLSAVLLIISLGPRPDIATAPLSLRYLAKCATVLMLAASAIALIVRLSRPDANPGRLKWALGLGPVFLAIAVLVELIVTPSLQWQARLFGIHWLACLALIPLFAIAPFAGLFFALKQAAPRDAGLAGAIAGLAAGGIAASVYVLHCPDDSPLFLAAWYTLAIGLVTLIGFLIGRRWLRW
ncbi:MAG: NrsF family protein [Hyphomicrobiales bacterium]